MKNPIGIRPVASYAAPRYPTREGVADDPSVLSALPVRWGAKPAVCMALLFTLSSGLAGCRGGSWRNPFGGGGELAGQVVPVFVHGDGMSVYGCVSVAPPMFLSEEEAQNVIREEAERWGVRFTETREIQGDRFPATDSSSSLSIPLRVWAGTLSLDGYDPTLGIGFEFVSSEDVAAWISPDGGPYSSVSSYNMKGTAERLAEAVPGTAVFYDPSEDYNAIRFDSAGKTYEDALRDYSAAQKELMLENLRAQVRDFLDWLSAQGVI
ncbi:MAG: hypothetical protein KBA30_09595 [Clostridia bacterium]|nr:hypothetical protein [Clostridia bacterium]